MDYKRDGYSQNPRIEGDVVEEEHLLSTTE